MGTSFPCAEMRDIWRTREAVGANLEPPDRIREEAPRSGVARKLAVPGILPYNRVQLVLLACVQ